MGMNGLRFLGAMSRPLRYGVVGVCFLLASCTTSGTSSSGAAPQLVSAHPRGGGPEVITVARDETALKRFFSAQNLRETVFSAQPTPRLASSGAQPTGFLDTRQLNAPGVTGANAEEQFNFDTSMLVIEPLRRQQIIGGEWQADLGRGPRVALDYTNEPLRNVTENVLGGILGVNYIVSDTVEGTVTFRSEREFSKSELLQILSDILASRGYLIQYFNSVYHIGLPEELEQLTGLRGRSTLESDQTYVIELAGPLPENLAEVAGSLVPPGNVVAAVPGSNNLVVRGDPSQFQSIEDMVRMLAGRPGRSQKLAILPLRHAAPNIVATQMGDVYAQRGLGDAYFLPIEQRNSLLIVAESQAAVNAARELAVGLDVNNRDEIGLRVIQLAHLDATEAADQLNEIFGGTGQAGVTSETTGDISDIVTAASEIANSGTSARGVSRNGANAPRFLRNGESEDQDEAAPAPRVVSGNAVTSPVQITANTRNNALMVRSTYADFKRINNVVRVLDTPQSQVVIEATIVEVTINDALQYGVQAFLETSGVSVRSSSSTAASDSGGAGFSAILGKDRNRQLVLSALQSATNVKVISSPYLTVTNGSMGRLAVGDQIPYVTASQTSSSGGDVVVTQEVQAKDVGVILEVQPTISPSNGVTLDISQEISSAASIETAAGANPIVSQRSVQSQVNVQSGDTILLGGLIQERSENNESGVPVLRKIPVLGNAFNQTENTQVRTELLILLTPRVARNNSQINDLTRQLQLMSAAN
ncbi:secretin N-terminal domain-containing protein [Celeribacter sp.]|uniref:secretin N-terminal domain-containing protein n=1 Tax=Celeribacter sp. TaxID=1890673 RepID=UPI003A8E766E